jgi:hypothetical protein
LMGCTFLVHPEGALVPDCVQREGYQARFVPTEVKGI